MLELVIPTLEQLYGYKDALDRGWSPDNISPVETARKDLKQIVDDPALFIAQQEDREAKLPPVTLPDGSQVQRLPGYRRWIWDGEFCGSFGFRWQLGTSSLPPHVLGHLGYSVVPWKRERGYATQGLKLLLDGIRKDNLGLTYVTITTTPDNLASQKVVLANAGVLVEHFMQPAAYGEGQDALRYRIDL